MLPKTHRLQLRQNSPYFVFDHKLHQHSFSLYWRFQTTIPSPQAAVVVSKKTAPTAVERNRLKRVVRATLSPLLPTLTSGTQLVVVIRRRELEKNLKVLQTTIVKKLQPS